MKKLELITNEPILPIDKIIDNLNDGNNVNVQYSNEIYIESELAKLNEICGRYGTNLGIRFYSHNSNPFDCSFLNALPNVKTLHIDTDKINNLNNLSNLIDLQDFQMSVLHIDNYDFLGYPNIQNVEKLDIGRTYAKKIDLKPLKDFKKLKFLRITGQIKNIDFVGELKDLELLYLLSISKSEKLNFINNLKALKILKIFTGGRRDIKEIEENVIEELEINGVLGIEELDNLSKFTQLKSIKIEDQIRLSKIDLSNNLKLENIKILNCKTLSDINGLDRLTNLHKLALGRTSLDFENIILKGLPLSLKEFSFFNYFKNDEDIQNKISNLGLNKYRF